MDGGIECVGTMESGITNMTWSPDQEMFVLTTGNFLILKYHNNKLSLNLATCQIPHRLSFKQKQKLLTKQCLQYVQMDKNFAFRAKFWVLAN